MSNRMTDAAKQISSSRKSRKLENSKMNPVTNHQFTQQPGEYYTIVITDRDHVVGPYTHVVAVNIPSGASLDKNLIGPLDIESADFLIPFEELNLGTHHRFHVNIYRQPAYINTNGKKYSDTARSKFPLDEFSQRNNLELVSKQEYSNPHGLGTAGIFLGGAALGALAGAALF